MNAASSALAGRFDAVVVGASAGGVAALKTLLDALPPALPVPVLVVQHLPRDRPSQLAELFAHGCTLPVAEAVDKARPGPGTVWIAPPDYHLLVEDRHTLALSLDEPVMFSRPAIDPLFESAASVFGERLLALLLTGASSDGSEGIAAVRAAGGVAWIQSPDDAVSSMMPASALAHAGADEVLTLDQIRERLRGFHP